MDEHKIYNGVVEDTRSQEEKDKDYQTKEIVAMGVTENVFRSISDIKEIRHYNLRNQGQGNSCMANGGAKVLEAIYTTFTGKKVKLSSNPIYNIRSNKPNAGMVLGNLMDILKTRNTCDYSLSPSDNLTDQQIDSLEFPANFESLNNISVPTGYSYPKQDFYYIASLIQKFGAVIGMCRCTFQEWCRSIPKANPNSKFTGEVGHGWAFTDRILFKNTEFLVMEDSWGFLYNYDEDSILTKDEISWLSSNGIRLITKEFFDSNIIGVGLMTNFYFDTPDMDRVKLMEKDTVKNIVFTNPLSYGRSSNDIKNLQSFLQYTGDMPILQDKYGNIVENTGNYLEITRKAVLKFQLRELSAYRDEVVSLNGKTFGVKSIKRANEIISNLK